MKNSITEKSGNKHILVGKISTNHKNNRAMDLKAIQHEAFVFIGDKDEYAEIIPDGNIDKAAELMAEFVCHLWECGVEYQPDCKH